MYYNLTMHTSLYVNKYINKSYSFACLYHCLKIVGFSNSSHHVNIYWQKTAEEITVIAVIDLESNPAKILGVCLNLFYHKMV